jgi:hypothetical protein
MLQRTGREKRSNVLGEKRSSVLGVKSAPT